MITRALFLLPFAALTGCTMPSKPAPRFGLAAEHNLAVMLANPLDLVRAARVTPRLSSRRDVVFQHYTRGEDTAARRTNAGKAAVSGIGKAGN